MNKTNIVLIPFWETRGVPDGIVATESDGVLNPITLITESGLHLGSIREWITEATGQWNHESLQLLSQNSMRIGDSDASKIVVYSYDMGQAESKTGTRIEIKYSAYTKFSPILKFALMDLLVDRFQVNS
jgi:hypothetical protein